MHTVLASFPFDPSGLLSRGFIFDPGGFKIPQPLVLHMSCLDQLDKWGAKHYVLLVQCFPTCAVMVAVVLVSFLSDKRGVTTFTQV